MTTIPGPITYSDAWNIAPQSVPPRSGVPAQAPPYPQAESPHEGAYVETSVTPLGAREANRSTVAALLDAEGIPHFAVRGTSDHGTVIAVAEPDRERVLGAVFRGLGRFPGHLSVIAQDPVRAPKPLPSGDPSAWRGVRDAAAIQVSWYRTDPDGHLLLGHEYGCAIEFWRWHGGHLIAPAPTA